LKSNCRSLHFGRDDKVWVVRKKAGPSLRSG
jgi:hypothetical protein